MKLIYTKRSPYARKVNIFALEKGIDIDLVEEDLKAKSADLLGANPVGKVPTLILDDGGALADSSVICEYFEYIKPQPVLIPQNADDRFKALHTDAIAKGMADVIVSIFYETLLHPDQLHRKFINNKKNTIRDCLDYFERQLDDLQVMNIASISVACAIGYLEFRLTDFAARENFPKLMAWYDNFTQRPSFDATVPVE